MPDRDVVSPLGVRSHGVPAVVVTAVVIGLLASLGLGVRYSMSGEAHFVHGLFSVYFSINLVICYWEMCLFWRRDAIRPRADAWRRWKKATGRVPAFEFLWSKVPPSRFLSPDTWADVWATYSMADPAYEDRKTYGFNVDIANGFFTPIPTATLYAAFTLGFLPVTWAGILGVMLFWQWTYVSSLYVVSFFVNQKQKRISRKELWGFIFGTNSVWIVTPAFGLYVSIRLILDGHYGILGL